MTLGWIITPLFVAGLVFIIVAAASLIMSLVATPRGSWSEFVSWFQLACLAFIAAATLSIASGVSAWPFKLQRRYNDYSHHRRGYRVLPEYV